MSVCKEKEFDLDYLLQRDLIMGFVPRIGRDAWQTVYLISDRHPDNFAVFCGLLTHSAVKKALRRDDWDLLMGDGLPGFSQSWREGKEITTYHRFGTKGIRPLVICRSFNGAWPSYLELSEEFRHFHNLAEDRQRQILLDFDESGYEIEVARISENQVEINLKYLLQFLAATRVYLAIYFDSVRYSRITLNDVPINDRHVDPRIGMTKYSLHVRECDFAKGYATFSRLLGKVIVAPPPIDRCGKWPFEAERGEYVSFIIGANRDGSHMEFTSNPDALSNYFGANPGAPNYLTPVYFRREVLQKYYAEPERYFVEDGYLRCLGLWGMQIDNSHPTHIVAFLGDLGRDLPYREQLHWKQFNVPPPANAGISDTCFRRSFLAQFAEPESVDLIFRQEHQQLNETWHEKMGWPLFLDPTPGDEHILRSIHIPVTSAQRELDEQILWLAKLLVDSLNEEELTKALPEKRKGERGIDKFERFIGSKGFTYTGEVIQFLRDLQALRSTGTAHRKGDNYQKTLAKLGLMGKGGSEIMKALLTDAVAVLRLLHQFVQEM